MKDRYPKEYYESLNYTDYMERGPKYKKTAHEIIDLLKKLKLIEKDKKILDFGCAVGFLIEGFKDAGYKKVEGYEVSKWARGEARRKKCLVHGNLNNLLNPDIMIALDVLEHLNDEELEEVFTKISPRVLLVRIPVCEKGEESFYLSVSRKDPTHINCKTRENWIEFFKVFQFKTFLKLDLFSIYDAPGVCCLLILK